MNAYCTHDQNYISDRCQHENSDSYLRTCTFRVRKSNIDLVPILDDFAEWWVFAYLFADLEAFESYVAVRHLAGDVGHSDVGFAASKSCFEVSAL